MLDVNNITMVNVINSILIDMFIQFLFFGSYFSSELYTVTASIKFEERSEVLIQK